jgi:uncharacterized protein
MRGKSPDPRHLDLARLAADPQPLGGRWPLADLSRLADLHLGESLPEVEIAWSAEAELRPLTGAEPQVWLHLKASTELALCCQRCLGPVATPVDVERDVQFVADEALAAELDADSEHDVLALQRWMDLIELIEDELLLALPLVPRHEVCPEPLPKPVDDLDEAADENPFALLAALKKGAP